MIGIDTNVLIRFLVDDEAQQNHAARRLLSERGPDDPAFVSAVALVQSIWVLNRTLGYPMPEIVAMLRSLLATDGIVLEHGEQLAGLLGDEGSFDGQLADHLIAWSGDAAGCRHTVTFDRRAAAAIPSMELLS